MSRRRPGPRRRARRRVNEVAIEKKITVPPVGGRQDRAALAAGHVHADDGHVGRSAGRSTASRSATGSRASATTTSSARPASRSRVGLGLVRAPRRWCGPRRPRRAAARLSEPRLPAAADDERPRARRRSRADHAVRSAPARRRRPSPRGRARRAGRRAARRRSTRPNRMAYPSAGTCSRAAVPAGQAVLDHQRGQRQGDQGGDPLADGQAERRLRARPPRRCRSACRRSRSRGSASCRGWRRSERPPARTPSPSPVVLRSSWRNDAASRLSRSTRIRTSSGHSSRPGVEPLSGLRAARPTGDSTRCSARGIRCNLHDRHELLPRSTLSTEGFSGVEMALPHLFSYSGIRDAGHTTDARNPHCRQTHAGVARDDHRDRHGLAAGSPAAVPVPAHRAGRARLAPVPGLARGHRGRLGDRPSGSGPTA